MLQRCLDIRTGDKDKDAMLSAMHSWAASCWWTLPTSISENLVLQIGHPLSHIGSSRLRLPQFSLQLAH